MNLNQSFYNDTLAWENPIIIFRPYTEYIWARKIMLSVKFFPIYAIALDYTTGRWSRSRESDWDTSSTGAGEYFFIIRILVITEYTE